jgi:hypothetical protein
MYKLQHQSEIIQFGGSGAQVDSLVEVMLK